MTVTTVRDGIGQSVRRPDGIPKVKGEFAYSSDMWAEDMLWGATLRSPHARARIKAIHLGAALAVPGVHAVLTHSDVPGRKLYGLSYVLSWSTTWDCLSSEETSRSCSHATTWQMKICERECAK